MNPVKPTRRHTLILLGWLCCLAPSGCRGPRPAPPPADKHAALAAALETRLAEFRQETGITGVSAALSLPDGTVVARAAGLADRESNETLTPEHFMLAGSVGKMYVAALVLQLVGEGRLDLADPLAKFFAEAPWYPRLANHDQLTIRMLLSHTSGLPRWVFARALWKSFKEDPGRSFTGPERLAFILDKGPMHEAGKGFAYSDTNYILLGMIIEKLTGESYYELLQKRLLGPLGLKQTRPSNQRRLAGLAAGYTGAKNPFSLPEKVAENGVYGLNPQFEWTGGGVMTTPSDLVRWARALYSGDVLPARLRAEMVRPVTETTRLPGNAGYGLGAFVRKTDLGPTYGHEGFMPGYETAVEYVVQSDVAIAVQINEDSLTRKLEAPLYRFVHTLAELVPPPGASVHERNPL